MVEVHMITVISVAAAIVIVFFLKTMFVVDQQTVKVVERFGRYKKVAQAGLGFKIPLVDKIAGTVDLRIQQLDVEVETKTKDNVFVTIISSVQYFVIGNKSSDVYKAFYKLSDPDSQIKSYVFDVVRAKVPKMTLDNVFENKDDVAIAVKEELTETMQDFGYGILKALVTDINPDDKVKVAMNEINASERQKVAAANLGDAAKVKMIKEAEAEAESKRLQGEGIANQRKAIIDGLKKSVEEFQDSVPGTGAKDVMSLVLMTQYFDTLKEIGSSSKSNTILMPHTPGGMGELEAQLRQAIMTANIAANSAKDIKK
jgi:regulator of protease activity HflC (stomatin/prohibitin superfamily)